MLVVVSQLRSKVTGVKLINEKEILSTTDDACEIKTTLIKDGHL